LGPCFSWAAAACLLALAIAERSVGTVAAGEPAAAAPAAELVVVAKLADAGTAVPHCGRARFVVVMRYEVMQVVTGAYEGRTLYAAHPCPEMALHGADGKSARFRAGDVHRLSLRPARDTAGYRDAFPDKAAPRFDVVRATLESTAPEPCGNAVCGPDELCADRYKGHRADEEGRPLEHRKCERIPAACRSDRTCDCVRRHTAVRRCSLRNGRIEIDDYPR
jgi:hypothetical protein